MRGLSVLVALLALAVVPAALADNGPAPWEGGTATVTEFEGRAQGILGEIAERGLAVYCNDEASWASLLAGSGKDPSLILGFVPGLAQADGSWSPAAYTQLAPATCWYASEWTYAKDQRAQKWCATGTRTEYRTETHTQYRTKTRTVWKRKKVKGRWTRVRTRVKVRVPVKVQTRVPYEVPVEEICNDYALKLLAWETFTHETVHMVGVLDEAVAECYGMQLMAYFMFRMGTPSPLAVEAATDYASVLYPEVNPPEYISPECRPGGALDLQPERPEWPVIIATASARAVAADVRMLLPAAHALPARRGAGGVPHVVYDARTIPL